MIFREKVTFGDLAFDAETHKQELINLNDQLYATVAPVSAAFRTQVNTWHDYAIVWMNWIPAVLDGTKPLEEWIHSGQFLVSEGQRLANAAANYSLSDRFVAWGVAWSDFARQVIAPTLVDAGKLAADTAKAIANEASGVASSITFGAAKPILIAGAVIVLLALALKKSGVKAGYGPISIGN